MTRRTINLDNALYRYVVGHSVREHPILAELRAHTANLPGARMQIGPEQGQFMAMLARLTGAVNCLEIGTFTGYSALVMAMALPENGRITCLELDAEVIKVAKRFWRKAKLDDRIDVLLGPAADSLDALLADGKAGHFDFAFIDADKEGYEGYFENSLALLKPGGLICVDNVLWSGRVAKADHHDPATDALRAFNSARLTDERVEISLVPIGDGLLLAHKKAEC
jgi:caffeoyl-CoA O-methyltransferase